MTMIRTHAAIVLRPTPFQEGGLIVSFLTEHGERITGLAKGAKKPAAKWVSAFEPLGLVRVSFFGKEHVEIRRGVVYINNKQLDEPYVVHPGPFERRSMVLEADEYFVAGDNRANSENGRVRRERIVGKVLL